MSPSKSYSGLLRQHPKLTQHENILKKLNLADWKIEVYYATHESQVVWKCVTKKGKTPKVKI